MVFDREGYSPGFFAEMWREHRIGCITYHEHPHGQWPEEWFQSHEVTMAGGETVSMALAERTSKQPGKPAHTTSVCTVRAKARP